MNKYAGNVVCVMWLLLRYVFICFTVFKYAIIQNNNVYVQVYPF